MLQPEPRNLIIMSAKNVIGFGDAVLNTITGTSREFAEILELVPPRRRMITLRGERITD